MAGRLYYVLENLDAFKGLSISRGPNNGRITPAQDLSRTDWPGVSFGPVVSQFMLADFNIDGIVVQPKQKTLQPGVEYMAAVDTWLDVQARLGFRCDLHNTARTIMLEFRYHVPDVFLAQNDASEVETLFVEEPLLSRNGRDLAAIAFNDLFYTEAFRAMPIMLEQGIIDLSGPYGNSNRQKGFPTFGASHIDHAMATSSSSTRHEWYATVSYDLPSGFYAFTALLVGTSPYALRQYLVVQYLDSFLTDVPSFQCPTGSRQWQVHRVLRPEAYGGLVHFVRTGKLDVRLPASSTENMMSRSIRSSLRLVLQDNVRYKGTNTPHEACWSDMQ